MSETGATCRHGYSVSWNDEQGNHWWACSTCGAVFGGRWKNDEAKPMQIVPAGSVVLTADEAAAASYACAIAAEAAYSDEDADERRALAAKLGGGA